MYCSKCGAEIYDEAVICPKCGCETGYKKKSSDNNKTLRLIAKIFMLLSTIVFGLFIIPLALSIIIGGRIGTVLCAYSVIMLIPLAWCIPMTVHYWNKVGRKEPVSTAFKVCTLLFVSVIAGILMLCDNDY